MFEAHNNSFSVALEIKVVEQSGFISIQSMFNIGSATADVKRFLFSVEALQGESFSGCVSTWFFPSKILVCCADPQ